MHICSHATLNNLLACDYRLASKMTRCIKRLQVRAIQSLPSTLTSTYATPPHGGHWSFSSQWPSQQSASALELKGVVSRVVKVEWANIFLRDRAVFKKSTTFNGLKSSSVSSMKMLPCSKSDVDRQTDTLTTITLSREG